MEVRRVAMPVSGSFPSGDASRGFAFTVSLRTKANAGSGGALALALALMGGAAARVMGRVRRWVSPGHAVAPAARGVLIVNPRSGDGKADRVGLVRECRERGIEALLLEPGQDLTGMAEAAVASGADVIGMAGGDGSLGLVADVAARHGLPMVVVPAGTRNHLAMDLGLDRGDVVGALDAFGEAVERSIDLGEVNGRVFVNNVSLGLYAQIIRSPEYRNAKADTTLTMLPSLLGPGSRPFDLRFTGPGGELHNSAHIVQVSNNPYGRTPATIIRRPRLDGGRLGVITLRLPDDPTAARRLAIEARGHPERFPGSLTWETTAFEVDSGGPIEAGMDGEAFDLAAPLRFAIRPGALRIRLPARAIRISPAARALQDLRNLLRKALGRRQKIYKPVSGNDRSLGGRAKRSTSTSAAWVSAERSATPWPTRP